MPRQKIPGQSRIRGEVAGEELLQLLGLLKEQGLKWNIGDTLKSTLGELEIVKILGGPGKSGMGVVYIVLNEAETDVYAAKTFQPKFFDSPEAVSSFKREALVWIELEKHANIVRANHVEEMEHQPFIFMEFIAGSDLREKIGFPLSPEEILKYSIHFCRGMMHAAEKIPNFIHRDMKPENCLITQDGTLKVTDFGLAKSAEVSSVAPVASKVEAVNQFSAVFKTQSGQRAVGTLPYMAPELFWEEGEVDVGVDIYAFGMMLYEMLTGRLPFYPPSTEGWMYAHLHTTPPHPREMCANALPELADLSIRCLFKRRHKRPTNFAEIHTLLEKLLRKRFRTQIPQPKQSELGPAELVNKGASLGNLGRHKEAIGCFNKATEINPNFAQAYYNRGIARADMGDLDGAIIDYTKAIEINPKDAKTYYNRGNARKDKGDLDGAITDYNKAIEINPNLAQPYCSRAEVRTLKGDLDGAIADCNRAIEINPNLAEAYNNRGIARSRKGDIDGAIADYNKAIEINPNDAKAYNNRGLERADKGNIDGAIADYTKAIGINPNNPGVYYSRGNARADKGDFTGAIEDFEEFLRLAPGHPQASKVSQVIVELNDAILKIESDLANRIVAKLNAIAKPDEVTKAVELLLRRIVGAGDSLAVLRNNAPHDFAFDGAMILRGIYDAMLQALYILNDPAELEQRAQLYLDYYWIERREAIRRIDKNPTFLAKRIKNSPMRPNAEPEIEERFNQVKCHFQKKGKLRRNWYEGNLRTLAQEVGLETEYELLQKQLSGAVHSSPMTLKDGPIFRGFLLLDLAWRFSFRVLGKFAEFKGAILSEDEQEIVRDSFGNIYDYGTSN